MRSLFGKIVKGLGFNFLWQRIREQQIFRTHKKVASFWENIIQQYSEDQIEKYKLQPKKEFPNGKIIWQYWGQGLDEKELPKVVQICFESVDRYKGEYQVVRLTDDSIKDYIDLPEFVYEKMQNPAFNRVFFSDLLRLALLQVYGGVWLDATILLTDKIPRSYGELDYFVFQRDEHAENKRHWRASYAYYWNWNPRFRVNFLSSIFFAKKETVVVSSLLDLMLYYWRTQDVIIDYFFFQILYDELIRDHLKSYRCPIVDDTFPHLLHTQVDGGLKDLVIKDIFEIQTMHKLTYFKNDGIDRLKERISTYI